MIVATVQHKILSLSVPSTYDFVQYSSPLDQPCALLEGPGLVVPGIMFSNTLYGSPIRLEGAITDSDGLGFSCRSPGKVSIIKFIFVSSFWFRNTGPKTNCTFNFVLNICGPGPGSYCKWSPKVAYWISEWFIPLDWSCVFFRLIKEKFWLCPV